MPEPRSGRHPESAARSEPESLAEPAARSEPEGLADTASRPEAEAPAAQEPTRFAADVDYSGRADGHDYLVRVRHCFLGTSFTVTIDGVEHDPKAEQKAASEGDPQDDGLAFRLEENFTVTYATVRRPGKDGELADAEVIAVRTAGLGGAGEVDVRSGLQRIPLAPEEGSPSAARDRRRTAHPTRYALLAALAKAAGFLLPLLGIGALFSGFLRPAIEWILARIQPVTDAIAAFIAPIREWIADLLRPLVELRDRILGPVQEFLSNLLRPVRDGLAWLRERLLGWIPDLDLPVDIPDWVADIAVPVIVVLVVFVITRQRLRARAKRLHEARTSGGSSRATASEDPGAARTSARSSEASTSDDSDDGDGRGS
ncbi:MULTISPECIES: hypothetical protein [unclassified Brachybacterium]|uniref:hypothetical protein n=1 Tax=unclassified Brachybacterium TaxID=2623841 RepID=UPI00360F7FEC